MQIPQQHNQACSARGWIRLQLVYMPSMLCARVAMIYHELQQSKNCTSDVKHEHAACFSAQGNREGGSCLQGSFPHVPRRRHLDFNAVPALIHKVNPPPAHLHQLVDL